jgi:hypothetical protein
VEYLRRTGQDRTEGEEKEGRGSEEEREEGGEAGEGLTQRQGESNSKQGRQLILRVVRAFLPSCHSISGTLPCILLEALRD